MYFEESVEVVAKAIDAIGVAVIVGGVLLATTLVARSGADWDQRFREYRRGVGRSILLGLEFLVAADIIRTVAVLTDVSRRRRTCDHRPDPNLPQLYVGARDRWSLAVATSGN